MARPKSKEIQESVHRREIRLNQAGKGVNCIQESVDLVGRKRRCRRGMSTGECYSCSCRILIQSGDKVEFESVDSNICFLCDGAGIILQPDKTRQLV